MVEPVASVIVLAGAPDVSAAKVPFVITTLPSVRLGAAVVAMDELPAALMLTGVPK